MKQQFVETIKIKNGKALALPYHQAFAEAIRVAEEAGHKLYMNDSFFNGNLEPADPVQHRLRYNIMEPLNEEIIWADSRGEGYYGLQNKSTPYSSSSAWNGVAPTLAMVKRFYTKNGLPLSVKLSAS